MKGSVNLSYKINIFHFLFPFTENDTTKIILVSLATIFSAVTHNLIPVMKGSIRAYFRHFHIT